MICFTEEERDICAEVADGVPVDLVGVPLSTNMDVFGEPEPRLADQTDYVLVLTGAPLSTLRDPWLDLLTTRFSSPGTVVSAANALVIYAPGAAPQGWAEATRHTDLLRLMAWAQVTVDLHPGPLFGRRSLESLLHGTPIVVPADSSAREHAERGSAGLWFDDVSSLLWATEALLDPGLRATLGAQGRSFAQSRYGSRDRFVAGVARAVRHAAPRSPAGRRRGRCGASGDWWCATSSPGGIGARPTMSTAPGSSSGTGLEVGPLSVQVQTVLYNTDVTALERFLAGASAASAAARAAGLIGNAVLTIGDSSAEPLAGALETLERVAGGSFDELSYVHFGANLGSAGGHNRLFSLSGSDLVLVINPDAYASPHLLEELILGLDDGVGIVEARQLPLEHPKVHDPLTHDVSWASGSCFLVRSAVIKTTGGFDPELFFMYCDDVDFSWRGSAGRLAGGPSSSGPGVP